MNNKLFELYHFVATFELEIYLNNKCYNITYIVQQCLIYFQSVYSFFAYRKLKPYIEMME